NTYMNTYAFSSALKYLNEKRVPLIQGWSGVGDDRLTWGAQQTPWNVYYTIRNADGVHVFAHWLDAALTHWNADGRLPSGCAQHPYWIGEVYLDSSQDQRRADEFQRVW